MSWGGYLRRLLEVTYVSFGPISVAFACFGWLP